MAFKLTTAACAVLLLLGPAGAQSTPTPFERPDAAKVTIPALPLQFSEKDRRDSDTIFYFHKPGVSYETAFADLDQCRLYGITSGMVMTTPRKFVALGSDIVTPENHAAADWQHFWYYQQYGLVGGLTADIIFAIAIAQVQEDFANATMRRCMMYKGYARYGTSGSAWKAIEAGTETDKLARLALIASGPQPTTGEIGP